MPASLLGITARAGNPDGAWEFLKFILDYDFEVNYLNYFPVRLSSLNKMVEDAKKSTKISLDFRVEVDVGDRMEASINQTMEAIKATKMIYRKNNDIENIIMEEVDSFLAGQKSADTVIDIIENRMRIYIAEQE